MGGENPAQIVAQQLEGAPRAAHHFGMRDQIGQEAAEHQAIMQRVFKGVGDIGLPHRQGIRIGVAAARASGQRRGRMVECALDHFRENVIAAGKMLVRRLMRDAEPARHLAQAELFQAHARRRGRAPLRRRPRAGLWGASWRGGPDVRSFRQADADPGFAFSGDADGGLGK